MSTISQVTQLPTKVLLAS